MAAHSLNRGINTPTNTALASAPTARHKLERDGGLSSQATVQISGLLPTTAASSPSRALTT